MTCLITRRTVIAAALGALATQAHSAARRYRLVPQNSKVAFGFIVNGAAQSGTLPILNADIRVDTSDLTRSSADVTGDIRRAKTGLAFVTQALLSADVLDAANHPTVRFRSKNIALGRKGRISEGARITGDLTLRGVTRPLTLNALLSRPSGTAPDDLSTLTIQLNGALNRQDFGAVGYPKLVTDTVTLDIRAEIRAT